MKTKHYSFYLRATLFACAVFGIALFVLVPEIKGQAADHNVSGWAWSSTTGWISTNCADMGTCGTVDYGVDVDTGTGAFSGYAWSSTIGWIKFNPTTTPPGEAGAAPATLNLATNEVSGWIRACSAVANKATCEGAVDPESGGWDGWIKLRDSAAPAYGVSRNSATQELEGWAWGSDVVGWISFNDVTDGGVDHEVVSDLGGPPTASFTCDPACTVWNTELLTMRNTSTDPDGAIEQSDWNIISFGSNPNLTCVSCDYTLPVLAPGPYQVELTVLSEGQSDTSSPTSITIKRDTAADFDCSLTGAVGSYVDCGTLRFVAGATVYFDDTSIESEDGSTITSRSWTFEDGTPATDTGDKGSTIFDTRGTKSITLVATDNSGRSGTVIKTIDISTSFPGWREVSPF